MALFYTGDTFELTDKFLVSPGNAADWFQQQLQYAIYLATQAGNWQADGLITELQASQAAAFAYADFFYMPDPTGSIVAYALLPANLPSGCLCCDGSSYATTDYPVLFGKIGYLFGGAGANFNVPDLRSRTIIGVGQGSGLTLRNLGNSVGEETHTLVTNEIPSHAHSIETTTPDLALGPGEIPVLTPIPIIVSYTGSVGGDAAHNNMQPSFALTYAIVTGQ